MLVLPDHVAVRLVAEHARRSRPRTRSAMASRSSFVATPPVGLCGEFRKIAFGRFDVLEELLDRVQVRAERVLLRSGDVYRHAAPAADVRLEGRELRGEEQHRVAGLEEHLAEELLEHLRPGPDDDVLRSGRDAELRRVPSRRSARGTRAGRATGSTASARRRSPSSPRRAPTSCSGTGCRRSAARSRPCRRP